MNKKNVFDWLLHGEFSMEEENIGELVVNNIKNEKVWKNQVVPWKLRKFEIMHSNTTSKSTTRNSKCFP